MPVLDLTAEAVVPSGQDSGCHSHTMDTDKKTGQLEDRLEVSHCGAELDGRSNNCWWFGVTGRWDVAGRN